MKLEIREIDKSFGEKQVLRGISLSAESGKAVGILGRNGAGKTTTLRILMDVFPADSGEILLDGKKPAELPVRTFDNGTATVNTEICEKLGLDFAVVKEAFAPYCTSVQEIVTAESFADVSAG